MKSKNLYQAIKERDIHSAICHYFISTLFYAPLICCFVLSNYPFSSVVIGIVALVHLVLSVCYLIQTQIDSFRSSFGYFLGIMGMAYGLLFFFCSSFVNIWL